MKKNSVGAACGAVLVALVGGLATPTASHAVIYGGVFDPDNGTYAWSGTHKFDVSDACLTGSGFRLVNEYGSDCSVRLIGGTLTVKRYGSITPYDYEETLNFGSEPAYGGFDYPIWGINVVNNELFGVDSYAFGGFRFDNQDKLGGDWFVSWNTGLDDCERFGCEARFASVLSSVSPLSEPVNPSYVSLSNAGATGLPGRTDRPVTFVNLSTPAAVPEPTTVTLVLAALGAGWMTRRRKKR